MERQIESELLAANLVRPADLLERLSQANIEVLRTGQMGAITIRTDGQHVEGNRAAGR
jgi:beta-lactamase superfamily II metal-dependent hydrolase